MTINPDLSTINVTIDDLKLIVYFVINKFLTDPLHLQGTSSKRDLIGGFLDRWVNKASEYLLLNRILESKKREYRVVSDFYLYTNETEKNAADVLGLVSENTNEPKVVFSKFVNGTWVHSKGMPFIEVKAIRPSQNLLAVRDTQMEDDHYYLFVETNLREDYLISLFEKSFFDNEKILNQIKMSKKFIAQDEKNHIIPPKIVRYDFNKQIVGNFSLIGIFLGSELKKLAGFYKEKESFVYLFDIEKFKKKSRIIEKIDFATDFNKLTYNFKDKKGNVPIYLPLFIVGRCSINFTEKHKTTAYFDLNVRGEDIWFNQFKLTNGSYKITFKQMSRTSNWREFFLSKFFFQNLSHIKEDYPMINNIVPTGQLTNLIKIFDKLWKNK